MFRNARVSVALVGRGRDLSSDFIPGVHLILS